MLVFWGLKNKPSKDGTIEHNASPYWQDNGWPLNKDGSCCVLYFLTYLLPRGSGLGIEGYLTCRKDELGNHTLGTKAQNMHQLRVFGAK